MIWGNSRNLSSMQTIDRKGVAPSRWEADEKRTDLSNRKLERNWSDWGTLV